VGVSTGGRDVELAVAVAFSRATMVAKTKTTTSSSFLSWRIGTWAEVGLQFGAGLWAAWWAAAWAARLGEASFLYLFYLFTVL
jgi:hypothetical protein